jgi:hypothetical protein
MSAAGTNKSIPVGVVEAGTLSTDSLSTRQPQ